ncbi:uncharacterized protein LOC114522427 [Dendronephthya gigantea]|uniref:uncharacterized protein LOC114522427 n=1 Tax=Dendronephthya gigantea TaxID=151771 RepID=UPI00106D1A42|nr:uncharacterized protein LOC114522427 [Dendronephthya gigantea]
MPNKMVENSTNITDVTDTKDDSVHKSLLLVTVREGNSVLPVVLRRLSEDGKVMIGWEQSCGGGFRKIEPKPRHESDDHECEGGNGGDTRSPRILESRSTRRGVRICPTCQGRVGYRSKVCKHCWLSSGNSSRPTTNVKKRRVRQRKDKASIKHNTGVVGREMVDVDGQSTEGGPNTMSIDNFEVQMNNSKSDEPLLYVHVPTTSELVDHYGETTEVALSGDDACTMANPNDNADHSNVAYETQIRTDAFSADKSSFDENDQVHCQHSDVDSSRRESLEQLCRQSVDHEPGTETRTADVSYYITENSAYGGASNRVRAGHKSRPGNLADIEGNMARNICHLPEVGRERLASGEKSVNCNESEDAQNEEKISVESRPGELVVPDGEECHPSVRIDVDNVGLVSVTTSDVSSKTANHQERSVSLQPDTSESTFGLETGLNNQEKLNEGCEEYRNTKRKKKARLWKGPYNVKKKPKVSIVQFVRIEPKPFVDEEAIKNKQGVLKQNRLLASNPTRRGVMLCPLCQKDVGCRSRTCKYCKVAINLCSNKAPLDQKNLLAVQLCRETCSRHTIVSIKKTLNATEDRCFLHKLKTNEEDELSNNEAGVFSCDCDEDSSIERPSCEHILCVYRRPRITQARRINLKPAEIESLPIDFIFKLKLGELWEKVKEKEFPLVQQVCQNTLVVLDVDSNVQMTPSNCVHVRFEKIRRRSSTELHIFCSGKTCSLWNAAMEDEAEGEVEVEKDNPVTCLHYCVSLWAIASDGELQKYFKTFLDAMQVYLHSEVFDSVLKE